MRIKFTAAFGLATLLAGCAAPDTGPRATLHGAGTLQASATLAGVTLSDAAWPQANWWERYGDAQLNTLVAEALKLNPNLKMAAARVRQADAIVGRAEAADGFQLGFN